MIAVQDLRFTYPGGKGPVVKGLNFDVAPGEIFGFLGPSGAGKSTTQKILIGLLKGFQGNVSILDRDLTTWRSDLYEHIGVGFELPNHFLKLTALENLNYFRALYHDATEDPERLLELLGLAEDRNTRVGSFSKGMRMRLNFARALLNKPELLFLDEPTAGLDPVNARNVKDIVAARRDAGATVFLTTHNMSDAEELCDRVAFIVDGEVHVIDSPKKLKQTHGERKVRVEYTNNGTASQRDFALDGIGVNGDFLALLREHPVETIHTLETTLENVFIEVTGSRLQ